jgi:hypothetical protein
LGIIAWSLTASLLVCYSLLLVVFGLTTLYKGRPWFFIAGIFIPLLWILGAALNPKMTHEEELMVSAERCRLGDTALRPDSFEERMPVSPG